MVVLGGLKFLMSEVGVQVARVPYSLHSSFAEMEAFVDFLRPAAITGTPTLRA